jgi:putative N6-adenine-specific DNA methylase
VEAPIKETLAAALVQLSFWKPGRLLVDPFCGSGTIPIEAAMIGCGIAPGLGRKFAAEDWGFVPQEIWEQEREAANASASRDAALRIYASDQDPDAIDAARENAGNAGVGEQIVFETLPFAWPCAPATRAPAFADLASTEQQGIMVCNPPYGERTGDQRELTALYKQLGSFFEENPGWSLFLITADKNFEAAAFSRPANRRRKLYNGRIETTYYQYHGLKEPRK